ncbi:larval cuticle protein A2B-like [Onthophagus taurus]|uniref:larval cuticle protein A2B-like n=1 Tax=Onthophagus taurus TaxID=166361 RepID=UPI0039BE1488
MAFKIFVFLAAVAVARGGVLAPVANVAIAAKLADSEYDPNPQYTFAYDVNDAITGDSKSQIESRNGDIVQGRYVVDDPDGTRRTVDYTADPLNGFNAVVSKGPQVKAVVAPAVARVAAPVVAAPVAARIAAPVGVPAPIAAPVAPVLARAVHQVAPVAYPAPGFPKIAAPVAYTSPIAAPFSYPQPVVNPVAYTSPYTYV